MSSPFETAPQVTRESLRASLFASLRERCLDALDLAGQLTRVARSDVGLEHEAHATAVLPDRSVARRTTSITSSHSPSIVVNIASVRFGRPDSRTMRTASATAP